MAVIVAYRGPAILLRLKFAHSLLTQSFRFSASSSAFDNAGGAFRGSITPAAEPESAAGRHSPRSSLPWLCLRESNTRDRLRGRGEPLLVADVVLSTSANGPPGVEA